MKDEISNKSNSLATIQWQVAVSASNFYDSTSTKKATMMTRKNLTHSKIEIVSIQAQKKTEVEGRREDEEGAKKQFPRETLVPTHLTFASHLLSQSD